MCLVLSVCDFDQAHILICIYSVDINCPQSITLLDIEGLDRFVRLGIRVCILRQADW